MFAFDKLIGLFCISRSGSNYFLARSFILSFLNRV